LKDSDEMSSKSSRKSVGGVKESSSFKFEENDYSKISKQEYSFDNDFNSSKNSSKKEKTSSDFAPIP